MMSKEDEKYIKKEEKKMNAVEVPKKHFTIEEKLNFIKAGGSVKTKHKIDAQEICNEVRGKNSDGEN